MQKINYIAYDETDRIIAIGKDIDSISSQAEIYSRFKNDYGVRVYPILDVNITRELAKTHRTNSS